MRYNNVKTMAQGVKFDSRLEARRFVYLKNWENLGFLNNLRMQVKFDLHGDGQNKEWSNRKYIADFTYERNGALIIEDVKSSYTAQNETFRAKKQRLLSLGVYVKEILPIHIPFLDLPYSLQYKQKIKSRIIKRVNALNAS